MLRFVSVLKCKPLWRTIRRAACLLLRALLDIKKCFGETHVCDTPRKQTEEAAAYLFPVALGWLKSLTMKEEKLDGKGEAVLRKQNTPGASDRSLYFILQKALQNRCFHWLVFFFFFLRTRRSTDAFFITLPHVAEKIKSFRECITITNLKCFVSHRLWQGRQRFCISNAVQRAELLWHTNSAFDM